MKKIQKKKVLCFSATFYRGHEFSDLKIVNELKQKLFEVTYCVKSNEMYENYTPENKRRNISIFKKILFKNLFDKECGHIGLEVSFKKNQNFLKHNTLWIKKWSDLYKLIDQNEIIIIGSFRDNLKIISYARLKNKIVLVHKNPANFDGNGCIMPNIYCLNSNEEKETILDDIQQKKIFKVLKTDCVEVTKSVQFEFDEKQKKSKEVFFKKYSLDINKKLFLFLPPAPQIHDEKFREDYINICKIISKKYNLLIKGHPTDYSKRKTGNFYNGKTSWEKLCPDTKAVQPEEFHEAIHYCEAGISIFSTVFAELNNFKKPIIFVNRFEHFAHRITKKKINIEGNVYDEEIKKQIYEFKDSFLDEMQKKITENIYESEFINSSPELIHKKHNFIGCDVKIDNLERLLIDFNSKQSEFFFSNIKNSLSAQKNIVNLLINYIDKNKSKPNYFFNYLKIKKLLFAFKIKTTINRYLRK
jgi:hypothetical protein